MTEMLGDKITRNARRYIDLTLQGKVKRIWFVSEEGLPIELNEDETRKINAYILGLNVLLYKEQEKNNTLPDSLKPRMQ